MAKQLLTKKRAAWAKQFKPKMLHGTPITVNSGVVDWYAEKLGDITGEMIEETIKGVSRLFEAQGQTHGYSQDASLASQTRILLNKLKRTIGSIFEQKALDLAWGMLNRSNRANASSTHASLKELSGGLSIKTNFISGKLEEKFKAAIAENVSYIRSIQTEFHTKIEGAVMRSITTGNGLADLVPEMRKIGARSRTHAHFLALDQTRRANAFLTRQRLLDAGITHFRWVYTGRAKVPDPYHRDVLANKIFRLDAPPVIDRRNGRTGFPGDRPGCTCDMDPVIVFNEEEEEAA